MSDLSGLKNSIWFYYVPTGGDLYVLKHVLYNWQDDKAIQILQNCRKVMHGSEKLLVIERVLPHGSRLGARVIDLNMLALASGKLRTEQEFANLFKIANFKLQRLITTSMDVRIVEAVPI